jgi:hypothetical protein
VWPLDEGAACLLCMCAPWTRVRHTGDVSYALARPEACGTIMCMHGKLSTIAVQG